LLVEYERVLASIPACLTALFMPYKQRVEHAIAPGLTTYSWLSVGVDDCMCLTRRSRIVSPVTVYLFHTVDFMSQII